MLTARHAEAAAPQTVRGRRRTSPPKASSAVVAAALAVGLWGGSALGQEQPASPPAGQPAQPGTTAQPGQPGAPGTPGQPAPAADDRQRQFDQFRKSAEERLKVLLAATDDEWAVLKPRVEKIQQMQAANDPRRVGFSMLMSNASWRTRASTPADGQRQANDAANRQPQGNQPARWSPFGNLTDTATSQKAKELQEALESKEASPETLKARLAALRAAKAQAKTEMAQSQEELRGLCSVRQEAVLAIMGILE